MTEKTVQEDDLRLVADYVGAVRYALAFLDETVQEEPSLQKLDEAVEEFLNEQGVFV